MSLGIARINTLARMLDTAVTRTAITPTTLYGDVMTSTGRSKFGIGSAHFDGSGDNIYYASNDAFIFGTGDFTIEAWAWFSRVNLNQGLFDFRSGTGTIPAIAFRTTPTGFLAIVNDVTWFSTASSLITTNTWYHVCIVRASGTTKMYLDGVERASTTTVRDLTTGHLTIGGLLGSNNNPLQGFIDEVRISKTARYTAAFTPPTAAFTNDADTTFLLHFNDYNGSTTFTDDGGQTITQGTRPALSIFITGNTQISTSEFKFGSSSAYFDGTNDNLKVDNTDSTYLGLVDFTIEMWFYTTNLAARHLYDGRSTTGSQVAPLIRYTSTGVLSYYVNGADRIVSSANAIATNTWFHVAVSRSGNTTRMFLDGTQVGSNYTDSNLYIKNVIGIGAYVTGANSHIGYIDEVRISNTARYTSNFTPSTTAFSHDDNTILLLHMEGSNGSTTFTDSTS